MLLALLQADIPEAYLDMLTRFEYLTLNVSSLVPFMDAFEAWLAETFGTDTGVLPELERIGYDSVSVIVNFYAAFFTLIAMAVCHLALHFAVRKTIGSRDKLSWIRRKLLENYNNLTFGAYIRMGFELMLFTSLTALLEVVSVYDSISESRSPGGWVFSNIVAVFVFMGFVSFVLFQICYVDRRRRLSSRPLQYFDHSEAGV